MLVVRAHKSAERKVILLFEKKAWIVYYSTPSFLFFFWALNAHYYFLIIFIYMSVFVVPCCMAMKIQTIPNLNTLALKD